MTSYTLSYMYIRMVLDVSPATRAFIVFLITLVPYSIFMLYIYILTLPHAHPPSFSIRFARNDRSFSLSLARARFRARSLSLPSPSSPSPSFSYQHKGAAVVTVGLFVEVKEGRTRQQTVEAATEKAEEKAGEREEEEAGQ